MSWFENDEFVATVYESFAISLEKGDYRSCEVLIERMLERGFERQATQMQHELVSGPVMRFAKPSPIKVSVKWN